jgi:transcriptional regulator with XRE-family HTH domain
MEKSIYTVEYEVLLRLLKETREEAGITQIELARKLDQTQSFVSKIERGDRRLDIVQLRTLCQVYGLTLPEFVERFERKLKNKK